MSSFFLLLQRVHDKVYDSSMKLNYSEPKIYTGGVDATSWSKLSTKDKKREDYYRFRIAKFSIGKCF
jgi:hypothetical protein